MPKSTTRAVAKYNRKNTKSYLLRINRKTEPELLHHLENIPNKCGYIKQLINADIHKQNGGPK